MKRAMGLALVLFFLVVGCGTTGGGKVDVEDPFPAEHVEDMSVAEQQAWAEITCTLIGQGVCAVRPDVAPPVRAALDTVVAVNTALTGGASSTEDMKEWVAALQRSAELVKKKSFQNHVKNLTIILRERGVLNQSFAVLDLSQFSNQEIEDILTWVRICAGAMSIGLQDCTVN